MKGMVKRRLPLQVPQV
jgi:hypothetical protein